MYQTTIFSYHYTQTYIPLYCSRKVIEKLWSEITKFTDIPLNEFLIGLTTHSYLHISHLITNIINKLKV